MKKLIEICKSITFLTLYFVDFDCRSYMLSSTGGIASKQMSSLGIYRKQNCTDNDKLVYYNEQSGDYLYRMNTTKSNWKVLIKTIHFIT